MSINSEGNKFKKAHITGPMHNFLILSLVKDKLNFTFTLKDLNLDPKKINLSEAQVRKQILNGLEQANSKFGTDYKVVSAEFLSNDTCSNDVYTKLTFDIINEAHESGLFSS